ncbi:MAG: excinuclease ABC subunit UvrA [Melioribacteraceae bacterium]|nr:excinuclease ABC subunit UvrA [Melioribacteraceae bacterium]
MTKPDQKYSKDKIIVKGAREHNLKNVDLEIPRNKLVVVTGVSGSGKSSLVFDTVYAEGQRRYVESLSSYARQFLERINKPDVDFIYGISPAVAIEQKKGARNPRSTVGTSTEIYDYLRLLFARVGKTICFDCGKVVKKDTVNSVISWLEEQEDEERYYLGFPIHVHKDRKIKEEFELLIRKGFFRIFHKNKVINLNEIEKFPRTKKEIYVVIDRVKIKKGKIRETLADSIETTFKEGEGKLSIIHADNFKIRHFNRFYECCGIRYEEPEPRFFSFNNPFGACPVCQGFGRTMGIDSELVIPNPLLSVVDGAIAPWRSVKYNKYLHDLIRAAKTVKFPIHVPIAELTREQYNFLWKGFDGFIGIDNFFSKLEQKIYKMHIRVFLSRYRGYTKCSACKGSRLRRESLQVIVDNKSISDVVELSIEKSLEFFNKIELSDYELAVGKGILTEIRKRLTFLNEVGLGYLTLNRLSSTLSGGETQRINLATSLGSALIGTLYVLDEPSIGLHPRDNERLINILKSLRNIGNTVLVVEHDSEMMKAADLIVDMGPKAGLNGGEIIAVDEYEKLLKNDKSLTGLYLSGKKYIPVPANRKVGETNSIIIRGAIENNLKNLTVEFPLNKFVAITGVSGSGKSTLIHDVLYGGIAKMKGMNPPKIGRHELIEGTKYIDEIEIVDQSPIGKSPRSNPISYVKGFEKIRELFAAIPQAKTRGYKPGYFSFNVPGGRCETCSGEGYVKIEMQFLADLYLECEDCKGSRYKKEVRDITFRGKNIVDILNMTVDEALEFFYGEDKISKFLKVLTDVGLGYIHLGQPSNTLSGGEAQRIKLAQHLLVQKKNRHTLFIFDEPTTGLHFDDINTLLNCFNMLIQNKNSVVIIEHNLDVIKCADYIIDLGPEAGDKGGEVIASGTPEEIMKIEKSHTGRFLKDVLNTTYN